MTKQEEKLKELTKLLDDFPIDLIGHDDSIFLIRAIKSLSVNQRRSVLFCARTLLIHNIREAQDNVDKQ